MEWKQWKGKKIFIKLKDGGIYSGECIDVDESSKPLIFVTIIDKYNEKVTVVHSEIIKIKEEGLK
jgi:hypothetical protein